jgi:hypothetical protein
VEPVTTTATSGNRESSSARRSKSSAAGLAGTSSRGRSRSTRTWAVASRIFSFRSFPKPPITERTVGSEQLTSVMARRTTAVMALR